MEILTIKNYKRPFPKIWVRATSPEGKVRTRFLDDGFRMVIPQDHLVEVLDSSNCKVTMSVGVGE